MIQTPETKGVCIGFGPSGEEVDEVAESGADVVVGGREGRDG